MWNHKEARLIRVDYVHTGSNVIGPPRCIALGFGFNIFRGHGYNFSTAE
uniref:Uncharacterized protein n=1 Tax=Rhizophora mucronata TaxID=61149 RepID=A0A2P2R0P6_RHIMU